MVDEAARRRVAVDDLMLQVQLPGDGPGAERNKRPPREVLPEKRRPEPQSIDDDSQPDRRPFDPPPERRKLHDLHSNSANPGDLSPSLPNPHQTSIVSR